MSESDNSLIIRISILSLNSTSRSWDRETLLIRMLTHMYALQTVDSRLGLRMQDLAMLLLGLLLRLLWLGLHARMRIYRMLLLTSLGLWLRRSDLHGRW